MFLHLGHHLVITREGWLRRTQGFRFMNSEYGSRSCSMRPSFESSMRLGKMRQQEPAENKICIAYWKWSRKNIVLHELKLRLIRACLGYIRLGCFQTDNAFWPQRVFN